MGTRSVGLGEPGIVGAQTTATARLPLIVDMDGFLVRADRGTEAAIIGLENTVSAMSRAVRGERRDVDASAIAKYARRGVDVSRLPLQRDLVDYVIACAETGRDVHLVTSAAQEIADAIATRIGAFASVTGATAGRTMTNDDKLALACRRFADGFAYAGRAPQLVAAARAVVIAHGDSATALDVIGRGGDIEAEIAAPSATFRTWRKALRTARWAKNAMLFVPLMLGPGYGDPGVLLACVAGFLLLGVLASGTYLINDICDIERDRGNPIKRNRPLARGDISIGTASVVGVAAIAGSLAGAFALSSAFALCLAGYLIGSLAYSFGLKQSSLIGVVVRAAMNLSRIAMGFALTGGIASPPLLAFAMLIFLALSFAGRHAEQVSRGLLGGGDGSGRSGAMRGAPLNTALGIGCNAAALAVLVHYFESVALPSGAYGRPALLWALAVIALIWSFRIWRLSHRGKFHGDPVLLAMRDKGSLILGLVAGCTLWLAM